MRVSTKLVCLFVVAAFAVAASAEVRHDEFFVNVNGENIVTDGGGTGWSATGGGPAGEWIYYDQTDWWNQWFYNDPPDPNRWTWIHYEMMAAPMSPGGFPLLEVALNWSTVDFPATGPAGPPPMPFDEPWIERQVVFSDIIFVPTPIVGDWVIPDFNPEWVSIDVRFADLFEPMNEVFIEGFIDHECVPEPATMSLLALGGVLALRRRRRR